jgi:uncharacterized protein (TIGR00290 family)
MKKKTLLSWSSGKDSAYALYKLQQNPEIDLAGLFCTVNKKFDRAAMHGVRLELLKEQARNIGLPLEIIEIPYPCSNADYETIMKQFVERARNNQITNFAFGDLFLEDIRSYREERLKGSGIEASFPIWGIPTDELAREIIASGIKAVITCVDPKQISEDFVGRDYDDRFLAALPATVDPCGENGEFHSFVFDGPIFKRPVDIVRVIPAIMKASYLRMFCPLPDGILPKSPFKHSGPNKHSLVAMAPGTGFPRVGALLIL